MSNSLGRRVQTFRVQAQMTQDDLATRASLSRSYISRLENGDIIKPSADFLFRIARAMGVHPDILFEEAGYRRASTPETDKERAEVLGWLADETMTWTPDELRFWGRQMMHQRNSVAEWQAGAYQPEHEPEAADPSVAPAEPALV